VEVGNAPVIPTIEVSNSNRIALRVSKAKRVFATCIKLSAPQPRMNRGGFNMTIPTREIITGDAVDVHAEIFVYPKASMKG